MHGSRLRRFPTPTLLFALILLSLRSPAAAQSPDPAQFAQGVFNATNAARQQNGLPPLNPDVRLAAAALGHSQAMSAAGQQAHQVSGEPDPGQRLDHAGYHWQTWRENLG